MEGLVTAVFGAMLTFAAGVVFGATRINQPKLLVYSLLIFVGGLAAFVAGGNVMRIYGSEVGRLGEAYGAIVLGGFLCMSFGAGAVIAGSVRLMIKETSQSFVRRQTPGGEAKRSGEQ